MKTKFLNCKFASFSVAFEILFPIFIVLLFGLFYITFLQSMQRAFPAYRFKPLIPLTEFTNNECITVPDSISAALSGDFKITSIGYAPKIYATEKLMNDSLIKSYDLKGFKSVDEMDIWVQSQNRRAIAIIFDDKFVGFF